MKRIKLSKFLEGGRLTDYHKNNIRTEQLLNSLDKIAKEKVNAQTNNIKASNKIISGRRSNTCN